MKGKEPDMKTVQVFHYDAFTTKPDKGNPAGIVLNGYDLSEREMQEVARKVGFNETVFAVHSDVADIRLRYFTPGQEMDLCGHATTAIVYALKTTGGLGDKTEITIETNAGVLPVGIDQCGDETFVTMQQATPQFKDFGGSKTELAQVLGIEREDIDDEMPTLYGSTGTWTLLVPIKTLDAFHKMKPKNKEFPSVLKELPKASIHPFCMSTNDPAADMHARHFSSPFSGTVEDPVTGTASGVMGAYYAAYLRNDSEEKFNLVVEQGQEIGKDGRVAVCVSKCEETYTVKIKGTAVFVKEFEVSLEEKNP